MSQIKRFGVSVKDDVYEIFIVSKNKLTRLFSFRLDEDMERYLNELEAPYVENEHVQEMAKFLQHGKTTTLEHVLRVARASFELDRKLHLHCDKEVLIAAAILHDFYLYDWHEYRGHKHGRMHPLRAADNAVKYFNVDPRTVKAIRTHMWPLTLTKVPTSREAIVVSLADKYCSTIETLMRK